MIGPSFARGLTLGAAAALLACGTPVAGGVDSGDAGCVQACPGACRSLDDCDGGVGQAICAAGLCAAAGGAPVSGIAHAQLPQAFEGDGAATLLVRVLASARPAGAELDCAALLSGVDAGTLAIDDGAQVNPLHAPFTVPVRLAQGQSAAEFGIEAVPGGSGRLLFVEGFLGGAVDAGPPSAAGCASYDAVPNADGGAPAVGLALAAW